MSDLNTLSKKLLEFLTKTINVMSKKDKNQKAELKVTDALMFSHDGKSYPVGLIAKAAHNANMAYCLSIGDTSQVPWDEAPENIKQSAVDGVEYHIKNPDVTPEQSHEKWLKFKEKDGWVYGEVKDAEKKEHPCMVPYDQLPVEQKSKYCIFKSVVASFAEASLYPNVDTEDSETSPTGELTEQQEELYNKLQSGISDLLKDLTALQRANKPVGHHIKFLNWVLEHISR